MIAIVVVITGPCPSDGFYRFNTQVAVDEEGKVGTITEVIFHPGRRGEARACIRDLYIYSEASAACVETQLLAKYHKTHLYDVAPNKGESGDFSYPVSTQAIVPQLLCVSSTCIGYCNMQYKCPSTFRVSIRNAEVMQKLPLKSVFSYKKFHLLCILQYRLGLG